MIEIIFTIPPPLLGKQTCLPLNPLYSYRPITRSNSSESELNYGSFLRVTATYLVCEHLDNEPFGGMITANSIGSTEGVCLSSAAFNDLCVLNPS